jgi:hypothetical protein
MAFHEDYDDVTLDMFTFKEKKPAVHKKKAKVALHPNDDPRYRIVGQKPSV